MSTRVPLVEDIVITGNMFRRPIPNDENGPGAWTRRSVKVRATLPQGSPPSPLWRHPGLVDSLITPGPYLS